MQIPQQVGDEVRVRRARWRVVGVDPHEDCALLTLTGIGTENLGAASQVITPFDRVEALDRPRRLRRVGQPAWRRACRALLLERGLPDTIRTVDTARLDALAYQLAPARALLRGDASRVLIADDVGLGKTIQAAIAISELRARGEVERVLILTPAGLRDQWREELARRVALDAVVVDARGARARAVDLPVGVNPWMTAAVAIASIDYVKRPDVLPAVGAARWDLVVIDEAHGAATARDRHDAAAALCSRAAYVILLTATPHNGDAAAFAALTSLGSLDDRLLTFRRTRQEVGLGGRRRAHALDVRPTPAERRMHDALDRFAEAVARDRGHDSQDVRLGLGVLRKRALSSAGSLARTVSRRLGAIGDRHEPQRQMGLPFDDGEGEFDVGDVDPAWPVPALDDADDERHLLRLVADAAREAGEHQSKMRVLMRLLARLDARGERAIVFTEYRDTLQEVAQRLRTSVAILHGGLTRDERRSAVDAFSAGRRQVLLATDAAGEGLNLHHACRTVINLELPWNPVRLEQRAGRVDRIGQRHTVHAFHLIAREVGEDAILERLRTRIARARTDISVSDPLGQEGREGRERQERLQPTPEAESLRSRPRDTIAAWGASGGGAPRAVMNAWPNAGNRPDVRELSGGVVLLAFARGRARRWMGNRVLALVRSELRDVCGRTLATHVTPLLVEFAAHPAAAQRRQFFTALWHTLEVRAADLPDPARAVWLADSLRVYGQYREARTSREYAIWQSISGGVTPCLQPGLFDHRALRAHRMSSGQYEALIDEAARRVETSRQLAEPRVMPPRIVLLLAPR